MSKKIILLNIISFIVFIAIYLHLISNFSISWDEYAYFKYSSLSFDWFTAGKDILKTSNINYYLYQNAEHPMGAKFIYGFFHFIAGKFFNLKGTAPYRFGNLFFLLLVWYYYYKFSILFRLNSILSITAPLLLILLPSFFPHSFFCALDFPSAVFIFVMFYYFCEYFICSETKNGLKFIIALSCASIIKLNGIISGIFLLCLALLFFRKKFFKTIKYFILIPIIYFVCNPYFWPDPVSAFKQYIHFFMVHHSAPYLYLGKVYGNLLFGSTPPPPFHFSLFFFIFTTPISVLALFLVSICFIFKKMVSHNTYKYFALCAFLFIIFSIGIVSVPGKAKYDSTRLYLQLFPVFILLIVTGLNNLKKYILIPILLLTIGHLFYINYSYNPAQLSFFNKLTGGPGSVWNNGTQITYYGECLSKKDITDINNLIEDNSVVSVVGYNRLCFQLMKQLGIIKKSIIFYFKDIDESDNYFPAKYFNYNKKSYEDLKNIIGKESKIDYYLLYNSFGVLKKQNFSYLLERKPVWSKTLDGVILFALYKKKDG